jgi:phosphonopyruvate decarboxylase
MTHNPEVIFDEIRALGFEFFSGVPDSLLKEFCTILTQKVSAQNHVIAANEGNAIALGVGNYLASGKPPFIYMQNSGFGNAINPLLSLADPHVYSIPMLIMIGWRGEPGFKDEPQHIKQGRVMKSLLESLEIPYFLFSKDHSLGEFRKAKELMLSISGPVVILVSKNSFEPFDFDEKELEKPYLTREDAIKAVVESLDEDSCVVSTTGMASRELWEIRQQEKKVLTRDFLTVGSMGHASSIALGLNLAQPDWKIVCLDGDGAALMHLGSLAISGVNAKGRFLHVVLNNGAHDSVGGQPTVGLDIDFCGIAISCGYTRASKATNSREIKESIETFSKNSESYFLEIIVRKGSRSNLGRPSDEPIKNRDSFMKLIK